MRPEGSRCGEGRRDLGLQHEAVAELEAALPSTRPVVSDRRAPRRHPRDLLVGPRQPVSRARTPVSTSAGRREAHECAPHLSRSEARMPGRSRRDCRCTARPRSDLRSKPWASSTDHGRPRTWRLPSHWWGLMPYLRDQGRECQNHRVCFDCRLARRRRFEPYSLRAPK